MPGGSLYAPNKYHDPTAVEIGYKLEQESQTRRGNEMIQPTKPVQAVPYSSQMQDTPEALAADIGKPRD